MLARSVCVLMSRKVVVWVQQGSCGYQVENQHSDGLVLFSFLLFLQISAASHFSNDLGLDSLDTVEVVMAIEEVCHSVSGHSH